MSVRLTPLLVRLLAPLPSGVAPPRVSPRELAYGTHPLQRLDLYMPDGVPSPLPLIVFVHGGGWRSGDKARATGHPKINHFTARGFAYAAVNYRLLPEARVEDQAADIAAAHSFLRERAATLGVDASRTVVIGHSAGAHLAALAVADPGLAAPAGAAALAGIVLLDGAAYDVPGQLRGALSPTRGLYVGAFGTDPDRRRALSPALRLAAPTVPRWLILYAERPTAREQAEKMAAAARRAGAVVEVGGVAGRGLKGHLALNRALGLPDFAPTVRVDRWIDAAFEAQRIGESGASRMSR